MPDSNQKIYSLTKVVIRSCTQQTICSGRAPLCSFIFKQSSTTLIQNEALQSSSDNVSNMCYATAPVSSGEDITAALNGMAFRRHMSLPAPISPTSPPSTCSCLQEQAEQISKLKGLNQLQEVLQIDSVLLAWDAHTCWRRLMQCTSCEQSQD